MSYEALDWCLESTAWEEGQTTPLDFPLLLLPWGGFC